MNTTNAWDDKDLHPIGGLRSAIAFAVWNLGAIAAKYENSEICFLHPSGHWNTVTEILNANWLDQYMWQYLQIVLQIQIFYTRTENCGRLDLAIIDPIYFGV